jgi:hypothetical protein
MTTTSLFLSLPTTLRRVIYKLGSTDLPASTEFDEPANVVQVDIDDGGPQHSIFEQFAPDDYTFTAANVPEPTLGLLGFVGCTMLYVARRLRR